MTEFRISPDDLRRLARLVEASGLSELRYEEDDLRITLRTASYRPPAASATLPAEAFEDVSADFRPFVYAAPEPAVPSSAANLATIEAPVMGVFYRAPAPGAASFVEVGDFIEAGQAIGMIEAMKVFSEVLAEVAGRIREIPARNAGLVQPGETLMIVEVTE